MFRTIISELLSWKKKEHRKPVIIRGARQVGKTSVVRELGKSFSQFIEINFEENPALSSFFDYGLNPDDIIINLQNYLGIRITDGETLLFFDEIQACPKAIMSLRYFFEKRPVLHVIAAGSLIDFELENVSFPVGRIDFFYMYPLSFMEFLSALSKEKLVSGITRAKEIPHAIHEELLSYVRDYIIIGGMPQVVKEYIETKNLGECQDIQTSIIETFIADFSKYTKKFHLKYVQTVFNAIPLNLGRKLKYANISQLYQARELSEALQLLQKAGLALTVFHSHANGIPLEYEKDHRKFKIIFFDTGLAMRILRIPLKEILLNNDISLINEGSIAEQFVGQELAAYSSLRERESLFYWHREAKSSNAEVDYLIQRNGTILPIEVKSGIKKKNKKPEYFFIRKKIMQSVYYL